MLDVNPRPRVRQRYPDDQRVKIAIALDRLVVTGAEDDCWPWTGSRLPTGYGSLKFGLNGRPHTKLAHRAAFERANGYLPKVVRHSCDNPCCCNPRHLLGGNQKDNMRDMIERARARHARGVKHARAKLTDADVVAIRNAKGSHKEIARSFSVDKSSVTRIKSGKSWAHVPGDLPPQNPYPNRGRSNPRAKLTEQQVRDIFLAPGLQTDIATAFGVSQTTVSKIKRGLHYHGI